MLEFFYHFSHFFVVFLQQIRSFLIVSNDFLNKNFFAHFVMITTEEYKKYFSFVMFRVIFEWVFEQQKFLLPSRQNSNGDIFN